MSHICVLCDFICDDTEEFEEHISRHVYGKAKIINGVIVHWTTHDCNLCGKKYKHKSSYNKHVKQKHNTPANNTL